MTFILIRVDNDRLHAVNVSNISTIKCVNYGIDENDQCGMWKIMITMNNFNNGYDLPYSTKGHCEAKLNEIIAAISRGQTIINL